LTLKIITDQFKDVQLYVSGSSSFGISNELNEPLTGRKWEYELLPVSWEEFEDHHGRLVAEQQLENRLLYGFYPDVLNNPGSEREILKQLASSYLYRDILACSEIRKPEILDKLVQLLALQIGSEVNYNELATQIGINKETVARYIDILEKGYIVFRLGSFSRNLRNEIKKNRRRTKQQQEIDFVEEKDGKITGWEFKWRSKTAVRLSRTFTETYKADSRIIDRSNFREFVII